MAPPAPRSSVGAAGWMRSRRPSGAARSATATGATIALLVYSVLLLALIGMASPARFGSQGSRAFGSGWRTLALLGIAGACGLWIAKHWRTHRWVLSKAREPFRRPLEEDPAFAGAAAALAAGRGAAASAFALRWIWMPAAAALVAAGACLSVAYFLVDAVLARFEVGWQQPVLAAIYLAIARTLLRLAAGRLVVWPLAVSVHREATTGYP